MKKRVPDRGLEQVLRHIGAAAQGRIAGRKKGKVIRTGQELCKDRRGIETSVEVTELWDALDCLEYRARMDAGDDADGEEEPPERGGTASE